MTIMTRAEHRHAEDLKHIMNDVRADVVPGGAAEDYVTDLEIEHDATEADPLEIEDPHEHAYQCALDVQREAESAAHMAGASDADADGIAEQFYEEAYDAVLEEFEAAPTIEVGEL